ncbi:MAG: serine/threonine protein kinase [Myxococcales bacterium]|nr:serine/threonine protein kinase [Myxococcales bacterium]
MLAGRYTLGPVLGEGRMGVVYRAHDGELGDDVALKLLHRQLATDEVALARFRREVRLARRVVHPNVARVFDLGTDGDHHYLTMELIEGESLDDLLMRDAPLAPSDLQSLVVGICEGLAAAHRAGVVHRDLKPENILIDATRQVKITDFGIARATDERATRITEGVVGTPAYMSPEQVAGGDLDARSDVYSVGVLLFEMLTGTTPWQGRNAIAVAIARLDAEPPDPREHVPISPSVAEVVQRAMARRPADRYASAQELARAFTKACTGEGKTLPSLLTAPGRSALPFDSLPPSGEHRPADVDRMIARLEEAYCATPDDPILNIKYASVLWRRFIAGDGFDFDLEEAEAMARRASSMQPGVAATESTLAAILLERGEAAAAAEAAFRALALDDHESRARRVLAECSLLTGDLGAASRFLGVDLEASPAGIATRALVCAHSDAARAALMLADQATFASRSTWPYWLNRVRIAHWAGDPGQWQVLLPMVAAELFPRRDEILSITGALAHAGNVEDARVRVREIIEATPDARHRRTWLTTLEFELSLLGGHPDVDLLDPEIAGVAPPLAWLRHAPSMATCRGETWYARVDHRATFSRRDVATALRRGRGESA